MFCALGRPHSSGLLQETSAVLCVSVQIAVGQNKRVQFTESCHHKRRPVEQCQSQEFIIALAKMFLSLSVVNNEVKRLIIYI